MKKLLLIIAVLFLYISVNAQEKVKQQEVGLIFSGFNAFGLTYRIGSDKSLWRFQTLFFRGSSTSTEVADSVFNERNTNDISLRIGKEFRRDIIETMEFRFGGDLSFGYSQDKRKTNDISQFDRDDTTKRTTYSAGIRFMLGLNYVFHEKLVIGAEFLPYLRYFETINVTQRFERDERKRTETGFNYGVSNSSVLLSVLYRF